MKQRMEQIFVKEQAPQTRYFCGKTAPQAKFIKQF
jgi:c-di-AMP phosphodiesterase-like protein